jgi:hypothetical protein
LHILGQPNTFLAQGTAWLYANFALVAAEPSFLALPVDELASFVESDDLASPEEDVFDAVMAWVKEDEAAREAELGRLLPLVRFPMMAKPGLVMVSEPLVAGHPLAFQLVLETTKDFAESAQAAECPRLRPRQGQRLPAQLQVSPKLAFTRVSAKHYDVSGEGGVLLRTKNGAVNRSAVCAGHVMSTGQHAVDFTIVSSFATDFLFVGLARPDIDVQQISAFVQDTFWGLCGSAGHLSHSFTAKKWTGQKSFGTGDVVGLLLDCDAGTLTVKKNGKLLGVAATGLTGPLCWAASLHTDTIRIVAADGW